MPRRAQNSAWVWPPSCALTTRNIVPVTARRGAIAKHGARLLVPTSTKWTMVLNVNFGGAPGQLKNERNSRVRNDFRHVASRRRTPLTRRRSDFCSISVGHHGGDLSA